jgi:threonyl-tRNA synthetase
VHANYVNYQVKERAKFAEEISHDRKAGGMRNPLIVFACVEKVDGQTNVVEGTVGEIKDIASKVKTRNITLFPFAHLSEDLASPFCAVELLTQVEAKLKEDGFLVIRVPFGWYKAFEFKSKGHPLAVLSRSVPRKANPAPLSSKIGCGSHVE